MTRIGIWNLEPKYRNLALEKVRLYYRNKSIEPEDNMFLAYDQYDQIYCSSIFDWTPAKYSLPEGITKGGTGFDLTTVLPPEIDCIEPHLNFGFASRGCIRKCKFCVVPLKEGYVRATGDLLSLWDGKTKDIVLYDNNILALPEHFEMICKQAIKHKLRLDFNQGLDHRLLTPEIVKLMKRISHVEYHFAFDSIKYLKSIEKAIRLLKQGGINRSNWYVLVGYDSTPQEDLERLNYLRDNNQNAYVQRYSGSMAKWYYISLARWANQHHIFQGMTWEQFLKHPDNKYKEVSYAD